MYANVSTWIPSPNLDIGFSTSDISLISTQNFQDWKDTRMQVFLQIFAINFPLWGLVPTAYFPVCFHSKAVRLSLRFINAEKDSPLCGWVFFFVLITHKPKRGLPPVGFALPGRIRESSKGKGGDLEKGCVSFEIAFK